MQPQREKSFSVIARFTMTEGSSHSTRVDPSTRVSFAWGGVCLAIPVEMSAPDSTNKHFELAVGLSTEALKMLFLLNSGAAGALIALTDKAGSKRDYSQAIIVFGIGALLTVASFMFAYVSQLEYAKCRFASDYSDEPEKIRHHRRHVALSYIALGLFMFALIAGGYGMCIAFSEARRH